MFRGPRSGETDLVAAGKELTITSSIDEERRDSEVGNIVPVASLLSKWATSSLFSYLPQF